MNGARDQLLAGAGLAGDQHGALGFGDELGAADDFLHRAAPADDAVVIEVLVALADQVAVFDAQPLMVERTPDDDQQLVDLEGLLQIVERAELHRFDRALDGGVRGHHQDLRTLAVRGAADEFPDQVQSAELRHHVVDDQQIEGALGEKTLGLTGARRLDDLVAGVTQRASERLQNFLFVVDEENRPAMQPS